MTPVEIERHAFEFMLARILGRKTESHDGDFVCIAYHYNGKIYIEKMGHFPDSG